MNIQKFQKYSREISPLYPALADKAEAISRAIENSPINVTAISDGDGILVKHIIDSLYCAEAVARYADAAHGEGADGDPSGAERRLTLCDVGSGGGFPALPIAAALGVRARFHGKEVPFYRGKRRERRARQPHLGMRPRRGSKGAIRHVRFRDGACRGGSARADRDMRTASQSRRILFRNEGEERGRGACLVGARRARARADARGQREVRATGGQRQPCDIRLPKDIADTRALPARIQKDRESAALSGAFVLPGRRRRTRYNMNLQLHVNLPCPREMGNAHFSNVKSET